MDIQSLLESIDKDIIYKIITDLEGPRHPIDNMLELNRAGDYIINHLEELGIKTSTQNFKIKGFDDEFRNIYGIIGDPTKPALLIGSHYDTVRFSPGANDNLSGLAVSLEVARALMKLDNPPTIMIAVFTLEEGHPGVLKYKNQLLEQHGLINSKGVFNSAKTMCSYNSLVSKAQKLKLQGIKNNQVYKLLKDEVNASCETIQLASVLEQVYTEYDSDVLEESLNIVGSKTFMKKVIAENILIDSIIIYDCLGWIKQSHSTQRKLPLTPQIEPYIKKNRVDMENLVGNFIGIAADKHSSKYLNHFISHCANKDLDIPYLAMDFPLDHSQLKKIIPDILRSDHSPFWAAGIPGIFISDLANFRSELYHTPADQSQHIDYEMLVKVAQLTISHILTID